MTLFPTQYSTLSSAALGPYIAEKYGLGKLTCKLLLKGVNDTYLLENETDKYIFRIYRITHRSIEAIESEVTLLNVLKEKVNVSHPIPSLYGTYIQSLEAAEGTRYGVLFTYAKGQSQMQLNPEQLTMLGKELAGLHNISAEIQLPHSRNVYDIDTTIIRPLTLLKPAFEEIPEAYEWLMNTKDKIIDKLQKIKGFSYGYCHFDTFPKNFHFDGDGDKVTFFDFDFMGEGYLVNDIMIYWLHLQLDVLFKRTTEEFATTAFDTFISSYRQHRPLSDEEINAMPYLSFGFWIFYMGFHYENFEDFSTGFFNTKFLNDRVNLIKSLTEKYLPQ